MGLLPCLARMKESYVNVRDKKRKKFEENVSSEKQLGEKLCLRLSCHTEFFLNLLYPFFFVIFEFPYLLHRRSKTRQDDHDKKRKRSTFHAISRSYCSLRTCDKSEKRHGRSRLLLLQLSAVSIAVPQRKRQGLIIS